MVGAVQNILANMYMDSDSAMVSYLQVHRDINVFFFSKGQGRDKYLSLEVTAGAVTRFLASLIPVALGRMLYLLKSRIDSTGQQGMHVHYLGMTLKGKDYGKSMMEYPDYVESKFMTPI